MSQIKKTQTPYYSETILSDTGSVITVVVVPLRGTPTYLLYILLEIVSAVISWVSNHNFENSSFILEVLFLLFTAPVFHDTYLRETK